MQVEAYRRRIHGLQHLLEVDRVTCALVSPSADMRYLLGIEAVASERPILLEIRPDHRPTLVVPELEAAGFHVGDDVDMRGYGETQDPYQLLSHLELTGAGDTVIAVSDHMHASVLLAIQSAFPQARYVRATGLLRQLRMKKDASEIDAMRRAGRMADAAFRELISRRFSGKTELEIAQELRAILTDQGLGVAEWGPIVAAGSNAASPHHSPRDHAVEVGEGVLLDFGGTVDGYQADVTRTVYVGDPSDEFLAAYNAVLGGQTRGVEVSTVGTPAEEVDRATRSVITDAGFGSYFIHRTGHGVGLDVHEEPYIVEGNTDVLEEDMSFSVEPGVYLPGHLGVRIEDVVVVRREGPMRLTEATRELVVVR